MGRNARQIHRELHHKTHDKSAAAMLVDNSRVLSLNKSSSSIKKIFHQIDEKIRAERDKDGLRSFHGAPLSHYKGPSRFRTE